LPNNHSVGSSDPNARETTRLQFDSGRGHSRNSFLPRAYRSNACGQYAVTTPAGKIQTGRFRTTSTSPLYNSIQLQDQAISNLLEAAANRISQAFQFMRFRNADPFDAN